MYVGCEDAGCNHGYLHDVLDTDSIVGFLCWNRKNIHKYNF